MIAARFAASLDILWIDFVQTFVKGALTGWIIGCGAALGVAVLIDRSPFLQQGLLPVGNFLAALPIVGIAPIMVMWFGFDWQSKAAVVVVMVFFPVLVNTVAGLAASEAMQRDLMRTWSASYTADPGQAAAARGDAVHFQRAEDFNNPGADRGNRGGILRLAHQRHGVSDFDRGRPAGH
jgi:hypothetical protein